MRTVGTAAAVGMATGIVGGVVGYFLVRFLVERLGIVEGPPAGVLIFILPRFLTAVCAFVGFVLAFLRLRGKATPHDE
jgi:cation transporter-like permease